MLDSIVSAMSTIAHNNAVARPSMEAVPFHRPTRTGREKLYVADSLDRALSGDAEHYVQKCESLLERTLGVGKVMLTTSCTHALEMCGLLLNLGVGDEVILPSFTFVSCANAIALRGATPVFADIRADSLTLDPASVEGLITSRTKAIMVINYAGISPDLNTLSAIAARHGAILIEDNAPGLFARQGGRSLGTFGALSTVSFDAAKNITCEVGGALLLNDPSYVARAETIREMGTDRSAFKRGEVGEYTWRDIGSNYLIADSLAARLFAQLEERESILRARRDLWERYHERLSVWAAAFGVRLPYVPHDADQPYHAFYLILPNRHSRDDFINKLRASNVQSFSHYTPLHLASAATERGFAASCSVTETVCSTIVRVPLFTHMTRAEQDRVIAAVLQTRP